MRGSEDFLSLFRDFLGGNSQTYARTKVERRFFAALFSEVKNAPTCYRAPRWPDPEFPRKIPKKYPPGRNARPRKYPQNIEKLPKTGIFGILGYFRGILGFNSGSPEFQAGGYLFQYFSWTFISGLCRTSWHSQL